MEEGRSAIRAVLAHSHVFFVTGMKELLEEHGRFEILACCREGKEAFEAIRHHEPDVAIVDITMRSAGGMPIHQAVIDLKIPTKLILLSAHTSCPLVHDAIAAGVLGVVLNEAAPSDLLPCVALVLEQKQCLPQKALEGFVEERDIDLSTLSSREKEVFELVAFGLSNKIIAKQLGLTEGTVKQHVHNIYHKLGIHSRSTLISISFSLGIK